MTPGATPFLRIDPRPGMMIDADLWRQAHEYHREQLNLHHLALHGWGVIQGLDVGLVEGKDNAVRIGPGLAVDSAGRFVLVPQSQIYQLTTRDRRTIYLVLQFRDVEPDAAARTPWRVMEAYRIQERDRLPEEPYIELARVEFDPGKGKLSAPGNPEKPATNELDLRSRAQLQASGAGGSPAAQPIPVIGASDDVSPRVDDLGQQVDALSRQFESLTRDVESTRGLAREVESVQSLAAEVATLRSLSRDLEAARSGQAPPPPAPSLEPLGRIHEPLSDNGTPPQSGVTFEQVSTTVAEHVGVVARQVDVVNQRVEALAVQMASVGQRVDAIDARSEATQVRLDAATDALAMRVDAMRHELDAASLQVQALVRQVDTLSMTPQPSAGVAPLPGSSTVRSNVHIALAENSAPGWDVHRLGLRLLARQLAANTEAFSGVALEPVRLPEAYGLQLLYLSGHEALTLSDGDVEAIRRLLDEGTTVVGEGCAIGPKGEAGAREFAMSFVELSNKLGRQLTRVDRSHPLMQIPNLFGELPTGTRATARVLESVGMVYSDADYGCAWQGGALDHPLSRAIIRDALEFGVNFALFRQPSPTR